ncbi:hypothetical protein ASPVEDRAFT_522064 [Aspergillus versicolor CBS 583.65]|uniref:Uncharacterized protein n=1 Tax=Aspergillus versicolor CBS 583.65 TaxID=1036611 RepID=A0A1L9PDN3_ASPVE|nr:uncharacterized protein ASPVEDRAFT_522064 [Aspergillus versicolor CBS 583.65]OJI99636.1 hypothetical protein ASPVEDRAFT_522064 [Aspergillus versicolor CBS 583.65]
MVRSNCLICHYDTSSRTRRSEQAELRLDTFSFKVVFIAFSYLLASSYFLLIFSITMDLLLSPSNESEPSCSELSHFDVLSVESESEGPPAQLAKEVQHQPFTTEESLVSCLECRQQALSKTKPRTSILPSHLFPRCNHLN